jgi:hypothetical protein
MTDDGHDESALDWSAASVDEGRLTVPLTGEVPVGWTKRVTRVVERLERPGSGWGAVRVTKKELRVDDVSPGSEHDLHHFLESVVLQANASLREDAEDSDEARSEQDQAMTDAFRALAPVRDRS